MRKGFIELLAISLSETRLVASVSGKKHTKNAFTQPKEVTIQYHYTLETLVEPTGLAVNSGGRTW